MPRVKGMIYLDFFVVVVTVNMNEYVSDLRLWVDFLKQK